ncbi:MAG: hypothetical protein ACPIOQ_20630 [Promethearchaeia archaeon]
MRQANCGEEGEARRAREREDAMAKRGATGGAMQAATLIAIDSQQTGADGTRLVL